MKTKTSVLEKNFNLSFQKSLTTDMEPPPTPTPMKEITLNSEWHEEGSEDVLISLKKVDGQQWGMGIGVKFLSLLFFVSL